MGVSSSIFRERCLMVTISDEWMPLLNECLAIALECIQDEETANAIKFLMKHLDEQEMNSMGIGAVRFVKGAYDSTELN